VLEAAPGILHRSRDTGKGGQVKHHLNAVHCSPAGLGFRQVLVEKLDLAAEVGQIPLIPGGEVIDHADPVAIPDQPVGNV
jgi:hypothetical protein